MKLLAVLTTLMLFVFFAPSPVFKTTKVCSDSGTCQETQEFTWGDSLFTIIHKALINR